MVDPLGRACAVISLTFALVNNLASAHQPSPVGLCEHTAGGQSNNVPGAKWDEKPYCLYKIFCHVYNRFISEIKFLVQSMTNLARFFSVITFLV